VIESGDDGIEEISVSVAEGGQQLERFRIELGDALKNP
jgi:hypothetical protein